MKMLIECSNIHKAFQGIALLKGINFKINDNDKIAIIGVNGAGKTTILKILNNEEMQDSGDVFRNKDLTIGYLTQQHIFDLEKTVYDIALDVFEDLIKQEQRLRELEQIMSFDHSDSILDQYDRLSYLFSQNGGFSYPSKLTGVLRGLGFDESEFDLKVSMLSGGQKTRLALARMLLSEPKLLLLDEPTNHLDNDAIIFLESYLKNYPHAVVIVSHDRYFIDQVTTKIIEIENGKSNIYNCKYNEYSILKKNQRNIDLKHYINQQKEIKKIQESIDTLKSFNKEKTIKRAESKEKQLAKINIIDKPESLPNSIEIDFTVKQQSGFDVLKIEDLSVSFDKVLFNNINIDIKKHERVALVGPNGVGKTTLFRTLVNKLMPTSGKIKFGSKVDIAYYDQEHSDLSLDKSIFKEIGDNYPRLNNTQIRSALALFNFRGDDVFKEIRMLSGGEKGRVVLTNILLKKANFLILDEPTNHLDLSSKEVLEDALLSFDGTIFFISHDRYFINRIATRVIELSNDMVSSYSGNYDDYLNHKKSTKIIKTKDNQGYLEVKQKLASNRKQQNEIKKIEQKVSEIETIINDLTIKSQTDIIINDYIKYNEIINEIKDNEQQLEKLLTLWEELHNV